MARRLQTEATGKFWKLNIAIGVLAAIAGGVMLPVSVMRDDAQAGAWVPGFLLLIVGVCWFMFARLMAWWFHG